MDWLKATNKQIRVIIESDGQCPPELLHSAVEEAIRRNIFYPYMLTIIRKRISEEYAQHIMKSSYDDIMQVFNAKAFDALKWYKPGKNGFLNFWAQFMVRALMDIIRDSKAEKRTGETVSIEDEEVYQIHVISDTNVERMVVNRLIISELMSKLSPLEKKIVILRDKGFLFPEIGRKLGFSRAYMQKAYNQALEKMREAAI